MKCEGPGEAIGDLAKKAGEAISKGVDEINPMNWGW